MEPTWCGNRQSSWNGLAVGDRWQLGDGLPQRRDNQPGDATGQLARHCQELIPTRLHSPALALATGFASLSPQGAIPQLTAARRTSARFVFSLREEKTPHHSTAST